MEQTFAEKVKQLSLPADEFIIIGSGLLEQLGIRKSGDIDLVLSETLYEKTSQDTANWKELRSESGEGYLVNNHLPAEAWRDLPTGESEEDFESLMEHAARYEGLAFVNLSFVRRWKVWRNRPKDIQDVALIDKYKEDTV